MTRSAAAIVGILLTFALAACAADEPLGARVIRCHEAWGLKHPDAFELLPSGEILPNDRVNQFLHGIRNHAELHSPIRFKVNCPRPGRFTAHVIETSGYGGSGLRIMLDGEVKFDREFPGETNTVLKQYAGPYSIDCPAGPHEIMIDNQGADWTRISEYRLTNYNLWRIETDAGTITVRLFDAEGEPAPGAKVTAATVGESYDLADLRDGTYRSPDLRQVLERGAYPVDVEASRDGKRLFRTQVKLEIRHKRLMLRRAAFTVGEPLDLVVRFTNEAGLPITDANAFVQAAGQSIPLRRGDEPGLYVGAMKPLNPGAYPVVLRGEQPPHSEATWLVVYEPKRGPGSPDDIVQLRPDGWFELRNGEPFTPLGFATIHVFQPTFDMPTIEGWLESAWNRAPVERVADWLALLSTQGINVIRIGLTVKWDGVSGDMGGYAQPEFLQRFEAFLGLCHSFGMRVIPVLYWGHWGTFGFSNVAAYEPLMGQWHDWYTNARAIELQQEFTRQMARPFAHDPRVFAWEPMNEIRPEIQGDPAIPVSWTNRICEAIREVDKNHLITISPITMEPYYHVYFAQHSQADFVNYHFYADFRSPPRGIADRVAMCTRLNQLGGKPAILGEAGATGGAFGGRYPHWIRTATRDCYWPSVLCGAPGLVGWDGHTTSPEETGIMAAILEETGWRGKRRAKAPVALTFNDLRKDLWPLIEAEGALADRGVWFDAVQAGEEAEGYGFRLGSEEIAGKLEALPRLIEATAPYAAIPMVADEGEWALVYLRNEGGFDGHGGRWPRRVDLEVTVNLPGRHRLVVWDIDARKKCATSEFVDRGEFKAAGTVSDYVLWATHPEAGA